jgi:predicted enzyme related to lactoylglutathione lyase
VPNPVVHFEITGADAPAVPRFYRDLFRWNVDADNEWEYGMVETGGEGGINGGIAGAPDGDADRAVVYAAVAEPHAYLERAERLGATTVLPVTDTGDVVIAMFRGAAGSITGLVKDDA